MAKRVRIKSLTVDQQQRVTDMVEAEISSQKSVDSGKVTFETISSLDVFASDGDQDAADIIHGLAFEGLRTLVVACAKGPTVFVSNEGKRIGISSRVGTRVKVGEKTEWQQALWREIPWDAFETMIQRRGNQISTLEEQYSVFRDILSLRERYPQTSNAGEAIDLARKDPNREGLEWFDAMSPEDLEGLI